MKGGWRMLVGGMVLSGVTAMAEETVVKMENAQVSVTVDGMAGRYAVTDKLSGRIYLKDGQLTGTNGTIRLKKIKDKPFGRGQAIEVAYKDRSRDVITLFHNGRFVFLQSFIRNAGKATQEVNGWKSFRGTVDLGKPAAELKTLGTGGLLPPDKNPGSYVWLAVAEPKTRNGVVAGWLTQERGSGTLFSKVEDGQVRLEPQIEYGCLRVAAGRLAELETLVIGYFDDARLGLEAWADLVAKRYEIELRPQPVGYCTWYSDPHGGASDEKHLAALAEFAAERLAPFGFSVVQIDDKWQAGVSKDGPNRNFTTHAPNGPYPSGMKAAADNIRSLDLVPGIWFMPFAGTHYDPFFKSHTNWFVKTLKGEPYETAWGGTCLDMTQPDARKYLEENVRRIAHEWGYLYFKMDGLWTGTATKQIYVNDGYRSDGIGDAVFSNPEKTNIEAYRDGLRLVRRAAGKKVFFLGCCTSQNMRSYGGAFGLVDAMRIGPDNGSDWGGLLRGPTYGSRQYFLHGRVWYNDPDPVYVRDKMPLEHARLIGSWVAISGQLNLSSEWLPGLPRERLDILKRTMPSHGLLPRPVDLFDEPIPRIWLLTDGRGDGPRRDVIALFNWGDSEAAFDCPMDWIGLQAEEYAAFDYWANEPVKPIRGRLQVKVPKQSCRLLAVRARADHPQVISTSRHVTQGMVDLDREAWDKEKQVLSGRSRVVAGDDYEIRIVLPEGKTQWRVKGTETATADRKKGVRITGRRDEALVRVKIESAESREVKWAVSFSKK